MDRAREQAIADVKRVLGMEDHTDEVLLARAQAALGEERASRCQELLNWAPNRRRWDALASIAALVAGTERLGVEWWLRPHQQYAFWRTGSVGESPETVLARGYMRDSPVEHTCSCLPELAHWIVDDAADADWGSPIAYADLNGIKTSDCIRLPPKVRVGSQFLAWFEPGGRVDVEVVLRAACGTPEQERGGCRRGKLGSELGETRHHDLADVLWAWGILHGGGSFP